MQDVDEEICVVFRPVADPEVVNHQTEDDVAGGMAE